MNALLTVLGGLAVGTGSAFLPILNADAYVLASVAKTPVLVFPIIVALTVGQTAGKLAIFETARRGSARLDSSSRAQALINSRWGTRIQHALRTPRTALPMVFASAGLGLPPLALVSVAAGAAGNSRRGFVAMCLAGRALRFTVLAVPVLLAVTRP